MRQVAFFVLAGLIQAALDTLLFGVLVALSVPTAFSNVVSRVCAALLGFVLNRYVTFGHRSDNWQKLGGSLARYVILFVCLTLASTACILFLESRFGTDLGNRVAYKIAVEIVLAFVSFLVSKHWVYRR